MKRRICVAILTVCLILGQLLSTVNVSAAEKVPAFPGAEGGGKYASGGRGGDVYVVTSLEDSGEGTLRYGIETAPENGRIIVFNVGGTIHLKSTLSFKGKKNITIAGQTAPGDGITIAGYDTNISNSENIILRFLRFRVGTENLLQGGDSLDALWGRDNDTFMIDHCSFSWSTDETLSTYRGKNGTVQWCLVSESLTVSGHSKGRHGYGGIWGGDNTVFQYNLMTNHTSRNPRIGGGSMTDPTKELSYATVQLSNNVIYNYGYYICYGGGFAHTNYINNYIKPGPGTRENLSNLLITIGESKKDGGFYIEGNILEGNDMITADNKLGIDEDAEGYLAEEIYQAEAFDEIGMVSAKDCYELVLARAGATYPVRDAVDARVVAQVMSGTGSYINSQDEVGGYPAVTVARDADFDTDHDGLPDEWEKLHGLNPLDASDSALIANETDSSRADYGYAWIELYCNELVDAVMAEGYQAPNPAVTIDLEDNTLAAEGKEVVVTAEAAANNGGTIAKVEFYKDAELVATDEELPYSHAYSGLADGTYHISVRAYDNDGNATQSDTARLHVNSAAGTGEWNSIDVGNPAVKGTASFMDGVLTVKGAGKLGKSEGSQSGSVYNDVTTDDFQYVYQEFTGDGELKAKLDSYLIVDNHTFNGLMIRESLENNAACVAVGLTMTKIWNDMESTWAAFMVSRGQTGGKLPKIDSSVDSASSAEKAGIPIIPSLNFKEGDTFNGTWLKLIRKGDTFTGEVSEDGESWQTIGTLEIKLPETVYIGFAVEAGKAANNLDNYATAKFSDIRLTDAQGNAIGEAETQPEAQTEVPAQTRPEVPAAPVTAEPEIKTEESRTLGVICVILAGLGAAGYIYYRRKRK
ncbi:MAG: hypothetical protein J6B06_01730 [Lachnospiraceae bacterium]|nr:hypothetical protein [Lachnospiraceae bacterium]